MIVLIIKYVNIAVYELECQSPVARYFESVMAFKIALQTMQARTGKVKFA